MPDCVASAEPNPVWDGSVLLGLFGQMLFDLKGLVRRLWRRKGWSETMLLYAVLRASQALINAAHRFHRVYVGAASCVCGCIT